MPLAAPIVILGGEGGLTPRAPGSSIANFEIKLPLGSHTRKVSSHLSPYFGDCLSAVKLDLLIPRAVNQILKHWQRRGLSYLPQDVSQRRPNFVGQILPHLNRRSKSPGIKSLRRFGIGRLDCLLDLGNRGTAYLKKSRDAPRR